MTKISQKLFSKSKLRTFIFVLLFAMSFGMMGTGISLVLPKNKQKSVKATSDTYSVSLDSLGEASNLPSGFTRVDYIQGDGTAYIDTKYYPNPDTSLEIKFLNNSTGPGTWEQVAGERSSYHSSTSMQIAFNTSTDYIGLDYSQTGDASAYIGKNNEVTVKLTPQGWYYNGTYVAHSYSMTGASSYSLWLFSENDAGSPEAPLNGRIYYCKVWEGEGNLTRNFVPCYNESKGVYGLYDTVEDEFYTNDYKYGSFTGGYDTSKTVTYGSTYGALPTPSRSDYTFGGWNLLPNGYTAVEYIETDGSQYFDTGLKATENTKVDIDIMFLSNSSDPFFGSFNSSTASRWHLWYESGNPGFIEFGYGNNFLRTSFGQNNVRYNISAYQSGGIKYLNINDTLLTQSVSSFVTNNYNMYLLARNKDGNKEGVGRYKLYSCAIYDNNTLVRYFIPCYCAEEDEYGLFDNVEGKFYSAISLGGDVGHGAEVDTTVTGSTTVDVAGHHRLYARWLESGDLVYLYDMYSEYGRSSADSSLNLTSYLLNRSGARYGSNVKSITISTHAPSGGTIGTYNKYGPENIGMDPNTGYINDSVKMMYGCDNQRYNWEFYIYPNSSYQNKGKNIVAPTDMSYMFSGLTNIETLDLTALNTSNTVSMGRVFYGCSSLTSLDVSGFDTSNVTNMSSMFLGCEGLTSIDVSTFDTSNVTNVTAMFDHCTHLESLDLSSFDLSGATGSDTMLDRCDSLMTVKSPKVTNSSQSISLPSNGNFYDTSLAVANRHKNDVSSIPTGLTSSHTYKIGYEIQAKASVGTITGGTGWDDEYYILLHDETLTDFPTATRAGYILSKWTEEDKENSPALTSLQVSENTTIYAQWTPASASLTFGGTTTYYATLAEAFSAVSSLGTAENNQAVVTVLQDITLSATITTPASSYIILTADSAHTITRSAAVPLITIASNTYLQMGTSTSDNNLTLDGAGYASYGVKFGRGSRCFILNGGTITNCANSAIYSDSGSATMNGGTISYCSASRGGAYFGKSLFTMTGGLITNCSSTATLNGDNGGGGAICSNGFTMSGGTIQNCSAANAGGAYANYNANGGPLSISGGLIENCTAPQGSAIYIHQNAIENSLTGGTIRNCTANNGNYMLYLGTVGLNLGDITIQTANNNYEPMYQTSGCVLVGNPTISGGNGFTRDASIKIETTVTTNIPVRISNIAIYNSGSNDTSTSWLAYCDDTDAGRTYLRSFYEHCTVTNMPSGAAMFINDKKANFIVVDTGCTVTLNANGGSVSPTSMVVGTDYRNLPTPTKTEMAFAGWNLLPEGYTGVEYIESTGTQYIDTGIYQTNNATVDCKFYSETPNANYLFGSHQNNSLYMYNGLYNNNSLEYNWQEISYTASNTIEMTQRIVNNTTVININGETFTVAKGSNANNDKIYIFACIPYQGDGTRYYTGNTRCYYFKMYENNILVRDFVPVKRNSDGKVGLWDNVTGTFFTNSGSGDFTAGPAVDTSITASTTVAIPGNHTLYAKWTANTYTVTFEHSLGFNTSVNPTSKTVTYGSAYGSLPTPTLDGYTSGGWYKGVPVDTYIESLDNGTKIRIHVSADGGLSADSTRAWFDNGKSLYLLVRYPMNVEDSGRFSVNNGMLYNNTKYLMTYGIGGNPGAEYPYNMDGRSALVDFEGSYSNGSGGYYNYVELVFKSSVDVEDILIQKFAIIDWSDEYKVTAETTVTTAGNHTLYPKWIANTYTVEYHTWNSDGTTAITTSAHTYGVSSQLTQYAQINALNNDANVLDLSGTGWDFAGWNTSEHSSTRRGKVEYTNDASVSTLTTTNNGVVKLYAVYTPKTYNITYELNSGSHGATHPNTYEVSEDNRTKTLSNPTKSTYSFDGWSSTVNGISVANEVISILALTYGDVTLTAQWADNTAPTVTINVSSYTLFGWSATDNEGTEALSYVIDTSSSDPESGWTTGYNGQFSNIFTASTYYVHVKDAAGNIGTESITAYTLTIAQGTGTTLTVRNNNSSGTVIDRRNTVPVLSGATIYVSVSANPGYGNPDILLDGVSQSATTATFFISNTDRTVSSTAVVLIHTITLSNGGADAGHLGTASIYERYEIGFYLDSAATSQQMTTSENGITVPTKTGYVFGGYWTGSGGTDTQYIDETGKLTNSASATNFSADGTLYARWSSLFIRNGGTPANNFVKYLADQISTTVENISSITFTTTNPTSSGYTAQNSFSVGATDSSGTTTDADSIVKAYYKTNANSKYDVAVYANGETIYAPSNSMHMFFDCSNLANIDFSNFNTSNVTNMCSMFEICEGLTSVDVSKFDTSNVTDMDSMFSECTSLTSLALLNFNTSNVTNMSNMFGDCSSLTSLDLSSFNTSNVTDMSYMFDGCSGLTSLDLSGFNTSKVTTMYRMFLGCSSLTSLALLNFNTSNVTNMFDMFNGCSSLTSLDLSSFNTSKVTTMSQMFCNCTKLTSLNLSSFNTSNVTYMNNMFRKCSSLTSLDLSSFDTSKVTGMDYMFNNCSALTSLDLSSFDTSSVTSSSNFISNDENLKLIKSPKKTHSSNTISLSNGSVSYYNTSTGDKVTAIPEGLNSSQTYAVKYTITADVNGGTITNLNGWTDDGNTITKNIYYGNTLGTFPTATKSGCVPNGWYDNSEFTGSELTTLYVPNESMMIYQDWLLAVVSLTVNSATTYYETLDSAISYINALIGQDVTMTLLANCSSTTHLETNVNYIRIYAGNYTITNLYNDTTAITLLTGQITNYYGSGVNSVIIVNNSDSAKGITTSTLEDGAWLTGEEGHLGTVTASGSGTMTFNGDPNYTLYSTVCLTHNITVGTITLADEAQVNVPISITTGTTEQTKITVVVALEDCDDYTSSHPLVDFDGSSTIYNACKNKFIFTLPGAYGEVKDETSYCIYLELLGGTLTITSSYTGCEAIAMGFVNITNATGTRTWSIMLVANQTYTILHIPFDTYTITAYASINHTATPYKIVNEVNTALTNSQLLINSTEGNTNVAMQVVVAKLPTSGQGTLYAGGFYSSNANNVQSNVNENSAQTEIVALNLADLLEPQVEDINLEIVETETINIETKDNRVEKQVADVQYIEEVDKDFAIQDVITDSKKDYIYRNDYIDLKNKYTNIKRYAI